KGEGAVFPTIAGPLVENAEQRATHRGSETRRGWTGEREPGARQALNEIRRPQSNLNMKRMDKGVAAYLKSLDAASRATLTELRRWIFEAAPHASETMIYRIPTYLLGAPWVSFRANKNSCTLHFCEASVVTKHARELTKLDVGKGCVRFESIGELPKKIILQMLKESA